MKVLYSYVPDGWPIGMELTRRNLNALLAKLDGNPPNSACTIVAPEGGFYVKAVEDAEHYANRAPGVMHPDTEQKITPHNSACPCLGCEVSGA